MLKRLMTLAALVAVASLAVSAEASAALPVEEAEAEGFTAAYPNASPHGLAVRSSNGYGVSVDKAEGHRVEVEASGADGSITYTVRGNITDAGIHVNLGSYGRIDMRWVPDGQVRKVRHKCHERGVIKRFYDTGSYVGTLRFRGGEGFTSGTAHRIPWRRYWYSTLGACGYSESTAEPGTGQVIEAGKRGHIMTPIHFYSYKDHKGAKVEFTAHLREARGRIRISRVAYANGDTSSQLLKTVDGTTTVAINPPAPFYGAATFERFKESDEGALTGDLGVEFPDHTKVGLTGKGIEATLHFESIYIHPG
jgi:hypothetical protein